MKDFINDLKNNLICWLIRHTHIYAYTIDEMIWQFTAEEIQIRVDMMKKAKVENGCFSLEDYLRRKKI